ncbi:hypothetical protein SK128_006929, partial [Halocaridina rubra]
VDNADNSNFLTEFEGMAYSSHANFQNNEGLSPHLRLRWGRPYCYSNYLYG